MNSLQKFYLLTGISLLLLTGCGPPKLEPVTGKVTLGGQSFNRLLVYFRPIDDEMTVYNNGVGETDVKGDLAVRCSEGPGLAPGKYRVSFTCASIAGSDEGVGMDEKADDNPQVRIIERVPERYRSETESPVEFEVKAGGPNEFIFDIPKS